MAERMTSIRLRDVWASGLADYGRCEAAAMITQIRRWAEHNKAVADAILAAPDEDFHIETYVGKIVERNREVIQEGRPKDA